MKKKQDKNKGSSRPAGRSLLAGVITRTDPGFGAQQLNVFLHPPPPPQVENSSSASLRCNLSRPLGDEVK